MGRPIYIDTCGICPQGAVEKVAGPKDLFQSLYHHFLCLADRGLQLSAAAKPTLAGGSPTPSPSVAAGVQGDGDGERVLCIRAMAAVYLKHAGVIGVLPVVAADIVHGRLVYSCWYLARIICAMLNHFYLLQNTAAKQQEQHHLAALGTAYVTQTLYSSVTPAGCIANSWRD